MREAGLREVRFRFDFEGTKLVTRIMSAHAARSPSSPADWPRGCRPLTEKFPRPCRSQRRAVHRATSSGCCAAQGLDRVVVCAGYLGEMIEDVRRETGSFRDATCEFSFDGPQLLGTAGALRKALPLLGDAFFVIYGDSYLPCDFRAVRPGVRATPASPA